MSFLTHISFYELALSLVTLGVVERLVHLLPTDIVGPGGWLLDTGTQD